jgi:hypothetical protein
VQPVEFETSIVTDRPELSAVNAVETIASPAGEFSASTKTVAPLHTEPDVVVM